MLPKRLKLYQAYNINFGGMADSYKANYLKGLNISGTGIYGSSGCSSGCSGSTFGNIFEGVLDMGMMVGVAALESKSAGKSANAQQATLTSQALNTITEAKAKVAIIQKQLTENNKELNDLNESLKLVDSKEDDLKTYKEEKNKLESQFKDDKNFKDYSELTTKLNKYTSAKETVDNLDGQIRQSEQNEKNYRANSSGSTSYALKKVSLGGGTAVATVQAMNCDINCYATPAKDNDGNETKIFNQKGYNDDLQKAMDLDANWQKAENEKNVTLVNLNQKRTDAYKSAGLSDGANINSEIVNVKADISRAQNITFSAGGEPMTASQYDAKLKDIEAKIDKTEKLPSKADIEAKITTKKQTIANLEKSLATAQEAEIAARSKFEGLYSDTDTVIESEANVDSIRDEYKNSKKLDKNGKNRTFLQRLFGTNKSDTQKTLKKDYKDAKKKYNQSLQQYRAMYGVEPTAQYLEQLKKKYGLGNKTV